MPDSNWWNFEDGVTDFGQLDVEHVDLAKLLVMEFALVSGNDVTDTFGVRTPNPTLRADAGQHQRIPWSMFKVAGENTRSDFILLQLATRTSPNQRASDSRNRSGTHKALGTGLNECITLFSSVKISQQ
jgi:hypothetical protein